MAVSYVKGVIMTKIRTALEGKNFRNLDVAEVDVKESELTLKVTSRFNKDRPPQFFAVRVTQKE